MVSLEVSGPEGEPGISTLHQQTGTPKYPKFCPIFLTSIPTVPLSPREVSQGGGSMEVISAVFAEH